MQIEEIKYSAHANEEMRNEIKNLLDTSHSLEQVLRGWFSKTDRGAFVGRGIDDEEPQKLSVCVVLKTHDKELAEIYMPDSEILSKGTRAVNIDDFIDKSLSATSGAPFDEERLDTWEASLGFEYNDFLCGELGPWDALVPYALAYVFSGGGEFYISSPNPDAFEMYEDEEGAIDLDSLLCIYATYRVTKPVAGRIFGFDTLKYVWKKGDRQGRRAPMAEICALH
jgi:hypothetical protein